ncbi:hypothetical protein [Zavarzinella formosa]|uniref:hypothetical protein n=1 Tax=Zavarzinella formosa TaxID=360055 RepID=UPI00035D7577|nr:hypothetical protein [Zavarzinella formosa]
MRRWLKWLKKPPEHKGSMEISPFLTICNISHGPEDLAVAGQITTRLAWFQTRMVEHANRQDHPHSRVKKLQSIRATWDLDADRVSMTGAGSRWFFWAGTRTEFMHDSLGESPAFNPSAFFQNFPI